MTSGEQPLFHLEPGSNAVMINLSECSVCGHRSFPTVLLGCERCGALPENLREVRVNAVGRIVSSALVDNPNGESFTVAAVKLEDGPAVRVIVDTPAGPGCPVRGEVVTTGDLPGLVFRSL